MAGMVPKGEIGPVATLLRNPTRLQLPEPGNPKATFFFRIHLRANRPPDSCSLLAASDKGKAAVVVYGENGMPYAYFGPGLLAFVDTKKPGEIDVFRGVTAALLVGATKLPAKRHPSFAVALTPVSGGNGAISLDFSALLRRAVEQAARTSYLATERALVLSKGGRTLLVGLNPQGSACAVRMASASTPAGSIVVSDVTPGKLPAENLFGVTLAGLKASGQPLRVETYRPGEALPWFPQPSFGASRGEVLASEAMQRLMPVDGTRVDSIGARFIRQQIADLRAGGRSGPGRVASLQPMIRIFSAVEWGVGESVNTEAERTVWRNGHPAYSYFDWKFNRIAYRRALEKAWGRKLVGRLTKSLERVALDRGCGLTTKLIAVDLLGDIGPGTADRDWAENGKLVSRVFAGGTGSRDMGLFLLGLIRARWGLPVGVKSIVVARRWLIGPTTNIALRVRALEILCFTGQLPDDRKKISKLLKAYLANPRVCIAAPVPGRYLYDLTRCRTGRKILLGELADRHSLLSGQPLLAQAAFNGALPGTPGFNLAVSTAEQLADDPKYSPAVRKEAFGMLGLAPMSVFRNLMLKRLGENARHFGMSTEASLISRKAAGYFLPQLAELYAHGSQGERIRIMLAIGFGFPKTGDASPAVPIIRAALKSSNPSVRWAGVECIGDLRYRGAKIDVTPLYPTLSDLVRSGFRGHVGRITDTLNCFSLATRGRWKMPAAGMTPNGLPNLQPNSGLTWWQSHYAAARQSALSWAARHKVR